MYCWYWAFFLICPLDGRQRAARNSSIQSLFIILVVVFVKLIVHIIFLEEVSGCTLSAIEKRNHDGIHASDFFYKFADGLKMLLL